MVKTRSNNAQASVKSVKCVGTKGKSLKKARKVLADAGNQPEEDGVASTTCGKKNMGKVTVQLNSKLEDNKVIPKRNTRASQGTLNESSVSTKPKKNLKHKVNNVSKGVDRVVDHLRTRRSSQGTSKVLVEPLDIKKSAKTSRKIPKVDETKPINGHITVSKSTNVLKPAINRSGSRKTQDKPLINKEQSTTEKILPKRTRSQVVTPVVVQEAADENVQDVVKATTSAENITKKSQKSFKSAGNKITSTGRVTRASVLDHNLTLTEQLPLKKTRNRFDQKGILKIRKNLSPIKKCVESVKNNEKEESVATSTPKLKDTTKHVQINCEKSPQFNGKPVDPVMSPTVVLRALKIVNSPNRKRLRERKFADYAESSMENSIIQKNETPTDQDLQNKIPVYQRVLEDDVKQNNRKEALHKDGDLYDFDDFNSDDDKKKKTIKKRTVRKPKAKSTVKSKNLNKLRDSDDYNKTVEKILQKVLIEIKKRSPQKFAENLNNNRNKIKPEQLKPILKENPPIEPNSPKEIIESNSFANQPPPAEISSIPEEVPNDTSKDIEDCFGFEEPPGKIHIITDITLNSPRAVNLSPSSFHNARPTANSTMIENGLKPWRYDDVNVHRHPYYLSLKASALPCLRQEMVLDHTVVDKFDESCCHNASARRVREVTPPRRSPVQTKVTEYFGCSNLMDLSNKENPSERLSFFDEHALSPLKIMKNATTPRTPGRRVLVPVLENLAIVPENLKSLTNNEFIRKSPDLPTEFIKKSPDLPTVRTNVNFGFDSDEETADLENENKDKPYRFSMSIADKKYVPKSTKNKVIKEVSEVSVEDSYEHEDEEENCSDSEPEVEAGKVGIFEELEGTKDNLQSHKLKKRRKARWEKVDDSDEDKPKKKRKNQRTKQEEEEAEKWAESFNAMCEEVEKFPLEIE